MMCLSKADQYQSSRLWYTLVFMVLGLHNWQGVQSANVCDIQDLSLCPVIPRRGDPYIQLTFQTVGRCSAERYNLTIRGRSRQTSFQIRTTNDEFSHMQVIEKSSLPDLRGNYNIRVKADVMGVRGASDDVVVAYVYGCVQRPSRGSCSSQFGSNFGFNFGDDDCCDISCRFACNTPQLHNYQVLITMTGQRTARFEGNRPITKVHRTTCFTEVASFRVQGVDLNSNTLPTTIFEQQVGESTLQLQPSPPQSPATVFTTASSEPPMTTTRETGTASSEPPMTTTRETGTASSEPPMTTTRETGTASSEPPVTTDSGNTTATDTTRQPENPSSADFSETALIIVLCLSVILGILVVIPVVAIICIIICCKRGMSRVRICKSQSAKDTNSNLYYNQQDLVGRETSQRLPSGYYDTIDHHTRTTISNIEDLEASHLGTDEVEHTYDRVRSICFTNGEGENDFYTSLDSMGRLPSNTMPSLETHQSDPSSEGYSGDQYVIMEPDPISKENVNMEEYYVRIENGPITEENMEEYYDNIEDDPMTGENVEDHYDKCNIKTSTATMLRENEEEQYI